MLPYKATASWVETTIAILRYTRRAQNTVETYILPHTEGDMRNLTYLRSALLMTLLCPTAALCDSALKLAGFQAYLFNSRTGQLSKDVLATGAPELGNVPAGPFGSVSTLVVVRVDFGPKAPLPANALQIRLVAQETGSIRFAPASGKIRNRILLDKTSTVGPINDTGVGYVGFWLDQTGCRTVSLKAYLVTPRNVAPLTGVLPFTCYE